MAKFCWGSTSIESFTRSVVSTPSYTFNWSVENFSKLSVNNVIKCPVFHPWTDKQFHATIEKCSDSTFKVNFFLRSGCNAKIKHQYSITDYSGRVFKENTLEAPIINSYHINSGMQLPNMSTPELEKFISDSKYDTLIIKCVMVGEDVYTERLPFQFRPPQVSSTLSKDLQTMYNSSLYADVILKVGDSIVRAHKSVMSARSSAFAKMFETLMGEEEGNVLVISDLELPVLQDLVAFLYTDVLAYDDFESVYALYYAADKYDVPSLRKTCRGVLQSKMDVENACRVLALADQHSDVEFKNSVLHFVKFYIHEILETAAFQELTTPLKIEVQALRKHQCSFCGKV